MRTAAAEEEEGPNEATGTDRPTVRQPASPRSFPLPVFFRSRRRRHVEFPPSSLLCPPTKGRKEGGREGRSNDKRSLSLPATTMLLPSPSPPFVCLIDISRRKKGKKGGGGGGGRRGRCCFPFSHFALGVGIHRKNKIGI